MANQYRLPIIRIIEGSGGGGSVKKIEKTGRSNLPGGIGTILKYHYTTENLAVVPVVSLGLGSVAGLGAARMASSHYSVMTKTSAMFVAGPPVVAGIGQHLSKTQLGGVGDPDQKRCYRSCRGYGGRGVCMRQPVSFLSAVIRL